MQEDARDASTIFAARLDAVRSQLDNVVTWSESQMAREETSGGSCGTASGAGRGPLYNARRGVKDSITTLRDGMTRAWLEPVQKDVELLRQTAASLEGDTLEQRQKAFETKASEIRGKARNIAARSNELGKSTAAEMRALADTVSAAPGKSGFSCFDPTLAQRLTQAAEQADQPAELKLREAAFNEGPAGVANAVKNLWKNVGAYGSGLLGYIASFGQEPFSHTASGDPITGRDLIALLATIGVDLGLLALAILNPPPAATLRPSGEVSHQIREAINTVVGRTDDGVQFDWVRQHFLHHKRSSYLVIPNLYSSGLDEELSDVDKLKEQQRALAMNQLAGVLADLDLVRWPVRTKWWQRNWPRFWMRTPDELEQLKIEETLASGTDLTEIRKNWLKKIGKESSEQSEDRHHMANDPLRNHGLYSKAERALSLAGWSDRARRDVEIFPIVDVDGLTPLLMVLNEKVSDHLRSDKAGTPRDGGSLNPPNKQLPGA